MRYRTCPRCGGAGERCNELSERWSRCGVCRGSGSVADACTTSREPIRIEEPTPMASAILDQAGKAVEA